MITSPSCSDPSHSSSAPFAAWSQRKLLAVIDFYQRAREGRPSPCRFHPSCSSYAKESLAVHGAGRGTWLAVRRLVRCRPFGPSGFDPVPPARGGPRMSSHLTVAVPMVQKG